MDIEYNKEGPRPIGSWACSFVTSNE